MTDKSITELANEVQRAQGEYESAKERERIASSETTQCLNRLNSAQKALTARMQTMMKDAPRDSDWARNRERGIAVE